MWSFLRKLSPYYPQALAVLAWLSLFIQWQLTSLGTAYFFSFFTILSNVLIALILTFAPLRRKSAPVLFFQHDSVKTAAALYIGMVALTYHLLLSHQWNPTGWQWVADLMLHSAIPLGYLLYWWNSTSNQALNRKDQFYWLLFPTLYFGVTLLRGMQIHWYPYPFINVDQLGYPRVMLHALAFVGVFYLGSSLMIRIRLHKKLTSGGDDPSRR